MDFNAGLAESHNLSPIILRHKTLLTHLLLALGSGNASVPGRSTLSRLMLSRLDCTYEEGTGNLTIKFIDPDPAVAARILTLYVDSLRHKLRDRAIASAAAAVKALQTATADTSDALIVGQLDQLLAQQIQQLETSEVEADFAFVVIDPPIVPPAPYSPQTLVNTLAAGILTPFLMCGWLILRERMRELSTFLRAEIT
ncbi:MAG: hypothetical protein ACLQU2_35480 [Candidatus Binataceae bacterium]